MARKPELGKWLLWCHFRRNKVLRSYLPATALYSPKKLQAFLMQYDGVYMKPQAGSRGTGIIKVWQAGGRVHVKHTVRATRTFNSLTAALSYINQLRGQQGYIVQRAIRLPKVNGRVFDIRVMVQKEKPGGAWQHSGILAKVAGPGSVVTNVAISRGRVMGFEEAVSRGLDWTPAHTAKVKRELLRLSILGAEHFDKYQPYREIGFDWAIDTQGRLWLLEENTGPSHGLFRKLKSDLSMYNHIRQRWKAYQRMVSARRRA